MMPRIARLAVPLVTVALAACTPFESLWKKPKLPETAALPAAGPELPLAEATHRFVVAGDDDVVGRLQVTVARHEDTLADIARRFNVGSTELLRANPGVDPWIPGDGKEIVLPTEFVLPDAPREGLVLNLAAMRLYYYPEREKGAEVEVITHPIGIGKVGWATPEGSTKVVSRVKDPVWTPPVSVRQEHAKDGDILPPTVPPGPDNPLGRHMLRLGWPSYLIHGTNKPPGVGMRASHGCIRLYPEDIERLFESIPDGTRVTVVNQPYVLGWRGGRLLAQAYEPLEDDKRDWSDVAASLRRQAKKSKSPRWKKIAAHDAGIDWDIVRASAGEARGIASPVGPGEVVDTTAATVTQALRVRNAIPAGATWDGVEDQYAGEPEFTRPPSAAPETKASTAP